MSFLIDLEQCRPKCSQPYQSYWAQGRNWNMVEAVTRKMNNVHIYEANVTFVSRSTLICRCTLEDFTHHTPFALKTITLKLTPGAVKLKSVPVLIFDVVG